MTVALCKVCKPCSPVCIGYLHACFPLQLSGLIAPVQGVQGQSISYKEKYTNTAPNVAFSRSYTIAPAHPAHPAHLILMSRLGCAGSCRVLLYTLHTLHSHYRHSEVARRFAIRATFHVQQFSQARKPHERHIDTPTQAHRQARNRKAPVRRCRCRSVRGAEYLRLEGETQRQRKTSLRRQERPPRRQARNAAPSSRRARHRAGSAW